MRLCKSLIVFIFLLFGTKSNAQKQFSVMLRIPPNISAQQVKLFYDNGKDDHLVVKSDFTDNQLAISKPFYSKYATISVSYQGKTARFWISEKDSVINFDQGDSTANSLQNVTLSNAFAVEENESQVSMNKFIAVETKDLEEFRISNKEWFRKDSLILIYEEKNRKLIAKKVDFVKIHGDSYYSFWLFRRELVFADRNIDSLLAVYNNAFPADFKNGLEGTEVLKRLTGRNLKKDVKAVDFIATDMSGKTISLKNYQGKYVLLTFWASWCVPCVAEFPAIKAMKAKYSDDDMAVIFVTLDADSLKFANAVKKYELNWTHIFNDIEVLKKYGVLSIPQVYLIDRAGTIIYSRAEENDEKLSVLTNLLSVRIPK